MNIYVVYEWYADADEDSNRIDKSKDIVCVYDSLEKAQKHIDDKHTKMNGLWSTWYTIEQYTVR